MAIRHLSDPLPPDLAVDAAPFDVDAFEALPDPIDDTPGDGEIRERAERWKITDDGGAEWAMRLLAAKQAEIDELAVKRDDWIDRITAWFDQAAKGPQRTVEHFVALLERYAAERYEQTGKATLSLPSGKVSSRPVGGNVAVDEVDGLVEWLLEHLPEKVEDLTETKVRLAELKKVTKVVEQQTGVSLDLSLECGHFVVLAVPGGEIDGEVNPVELDHVACRDCPTDPVDGSPALVAVTEVDEQPIVEQIVITEDGERVPWVSVSSKSRNYTVKPGA